MISFAELVTAPEERLVNVFCRIPIDRSESADMRIRTVAQRLQLGAAQLVCGLGFNRYAPRITEIVELLGLASFEDLVRRRNEAFVSDIYRDLAIDDVLAIYQAVRNEPAQLQVMQYLLAARLRNIEQEIDSTVNSLTIERYKKEMRAIYADGIAQIEFAEDRLQRTDSGFRALVNEVAIMVESRLMPAGDVFFRDSVLPEEKRKLISRGFIPRTLVESRLEDPALSIQERRMLEEQLRHMR